jgi:hypothetical protein
MSSLITVQPKGLRCRKPRVIEHITIVDPSRRARHKSKGPSDTVCMAIKK